MLLIYPLLFLLALTVVSVGLALLIACDRTRFVARFDLAGWRPRQYLAMPPNFLQALYDQGVASPWPRRMDAVAAAGFRFRVRKILRARPALRRRDFLRQHYNLWVLLAALGPFLEDAILGEQQRLAARCVAGMADSADRDRLIRFVAAARAARAAFARSLSTVDRQLLGEIFDRQLLRTLQNGHAIFREHGFCLLSDLDTLNSWQRMSGAEIVQELPPVGIPKPPRRDYPMSQLPLQPRGDIGPAAH